MAAAVLRKSKLAHQCEVVRGVHAVPGGIRLHGASAIIAANALCEPGARLKARICTGKNHRRTVYSGAASDGKSWKYVLTEYSIWDSPCMHGMQRGYRLACMRV